VNPLRRTYGTAVHTESNVALPWTRTIDVPPGGVLTITDS